GGVGMVRNYIRPERVRHGKVQCAYRGKVMQSDARSLEQFESGESIKGVADIVKEGHAPVAEERPLQFNAGEQKLFAPHDLAGGIARAERSVGIAAHTLVAAGKEAERRGYVA